MRRKFRWKIRDQTIRRIEISQVIVLQSRVTHLFNVHWIVSDCGAALYSLPDFYGRNPESSSDISITLSDAPSAIYTPKPTRFPTLENWKPKGKIRRRKNFTLLILSSATYCIAFTARLSTSFKIYKIRKGEIRRSVFPVLQTLGIISNFSIFTIKKHGCKHGFNSNSFTELYETIFSKLVQKNSEQVFHILTGGLFAINLFFFKFQNCIIFCNY